MEVHMLRRDILTGVIGACVGGLASVSLLRWRDRGQGEIGTESIGSHEARLLELGIVLPPAPAPVATYVGWRKSDRIVYIAGQGPAIVDETPVFGALGTDIDVESGYSAARAAGLNVLAQLRAACGGTIDRVVQCLNVTGYVNSADEFKDQPNVIDGASDLFVEVFGDAGKAARAAIGVNTLPFNVAVEIVSIWEVSDKD
jgi:enamine deaminase RidA (YjgF/YER057c/UK114 family)